MAVYQFVIELIPNVWFKKNKDNAINLLFDYDGYDTSIAWKSIDENECIDSMVTKILPIAKSWSKNIKIWGDQERNDIQISYDNKKIEFIKIRLDLRENINEIKNQFIELARTLDCSFLIPENRDIINPDILSLNEAILSSKAIKFINNSEKFLNDIHKED